MKRVHVSSTNIRSIGYDEAIQTLEVEFINGSLYQYMGVPTNVCQRFMAAASKGRFFDANLKDKYRTKKLK